MNSVPPVRGATGGMDLLGFHPNRRRTELLDQQVRERLADSLDAIRRALAEDFDLPARGLLRLIEHIRAAPIRPAVFALYTDIVYAIEADDYAKADRLIRALADPILRSDAETRVGTFCDEFLGGGMAERYGRILDDDPSAEIALSAVSPEEFARGVALIDEALELLNRAAPELAGEIDVLVRQIVLAKRPPGPLVFGGAATFYIWGCVFINPCILSSAVRMAEALTHESAHLLQFGMTGGNPVVENSDEERFASPLRPDPRPMEGIAHATYVLARMSYCLDCIAELGDLPESERSGLAAAREENRHLYQDGLSTVLEHARFTSTGRAIFNSCLAACPATPRPESRQ
jgi:hypothetical protein